MNMEALPVEKLSRCDPITQCQWQAIDLKSESRVPTNVKLPPKRNQLTLAFLALSWFRSSGLKENFIQCYHYSASMHASNRKIDYKAINNNNRNEFITSNTCDSKALMVLMVFADCHNALSESLCDVNTTQYTTYNTPCLSVQISSKFYSTDRGAVEIGNLFLSILLQLI